MTQTYSKKEWCILFVYSAINLLIACSISLQGPFYPMIAEQKGVSPTQNGFVFGVFNFGLFIMNPLAGVLIGKFSASRVSISGLFTIGVTNILFGFVNKISEFSKFLGISILIRFLESMGFALVYNAGIAIVSSEFSNKREMAFSLLMVFYSAGQFLGPVAGGALFELGGFYLPFTSVGFLLLSAAFVVSFLPKYYEKSETHLVTKVFFLFRIILSIFGVFIVFGTFINNGLILAVLELHLKNLELSPMEVGGVFLSSAIANGVSSLAWGKLCEKYDNPLLFGSISGIFVICGLILLGPAPYIFLEKNVFTCIVGLIIHGVGTGGGLITGFCSLNKGARLAGLPQNMQTSGIVSALFSSTLSLGNFTGAFLGGYLFEKFELPWGSQIFILYHVALFLCLVIYQCFLKRIKDEGNLSETISNSDNHSVFYGSVK